MVCFTEWQNASPAQHPMVRACWRLVFELNSGQIWMNIYKDKKPFLGQDPHIISYNGLHILCESQQEERISVSYLINDFRWGKTTVWNRISEHQVWAPELHKISGLWYIYYSSSDGRNHTHRTKVLGAASDPFGPYHFSETIGPDFWGIDMTTFIWKGERYAVWSGWEDSRYEFPQHLYIAEMTSPVEIGNRVQLSSPTFDWERSIAPILEGPQAWVNDGILYLLYSANASWMPEYATGMLELVGDNPLNPKHWIKCPWPLKVNAGHGHIVDNLFVYHRKMSTMPGWQDREIVSIPKGKFLEDGKFETFKGKM